MRVAKSVRVQMSLLLVVTTQVSRMVFEEAVSVWKTSVAERKLTFLAVPKTITPLVSVVVAVVAPTTSLAIFFYWKVLRTESFAGGKAAGRPAFFLSLNVPIN